MLYTWKYGAWKYFGFELLPKEWGIGVIWWKPRLTIFLLFGAVWLDFERKP